MNTTPHAGPAEKSPYELPAYCVRSLTHTFQSTKRKVTLCILLLLCRLLADHKLTAVGRRDITKPCVTQRTPDVGKGTCISRTTDLSLKYSKDYKIVVFLATMNKTAAVSQDIMKPEIEQFPNKTKGRVETLEQLWHKFCMKKNRTLLIWDARLLRLSSEMQTPRWRP